MDITCVMSMYEEPLWMVKRAIGSMEAQTYPLKEMIIIADKPENHELIDYVAEYAQSSAIQIRLVVNDRNCGRSYSRNRGYALANTEVICVMDADDESLPNRMEETVKYMEAGADIVTTGATFVDEEGKERPSQRRFPGSYTAIRKISRYACCVFHPTWLLKKSVWEAVGGYREALPYAEDYDFLIRALKLGFIVETVPKRLLRYTERPNRTPGERDALQMFLTIYVQNNVYRGKSFEADLCERIEAGQCIEYDKFKKSFLPVVMSREMKRAANAFRGLFQSTYFRRCFTNIVIQRVLRIYYLHIE